MRIFGFPSYPIKWRRPLSAASLLSYLIVLEGIGMLAWFLAYPSEATHRDFLLYSSERWILILGTTAILLVFLFVPWTIRNKTAWVENLLEFFDNPKRSSRLFLFVTLFLVSMVGLMVYLPFTETTQAYFIKIFPLFLWGLAILAQAWILLLVLNWSVVVQYFQSAFPVYKDMQIYPLNVADKYLFLAFVGISFLYLMLQVKSYLHVREAILIGDSWSYLYGAGLNLNNPAFFSERRPWGILLVFKLLGSAPTAIELFQLLASTLAWLWLAWTFAGSIQNKWIKLVSLGGILGFSLIPLVQVWNHAVLSESLSISLMVLILALFIRLSHEWKWRSLLGLFFFFLFWMSIREANAYVAIFVAITLIIAGLVRQRFRVYWFLSVCIGFIFIFNYQLSSAYELPRWALPLAEVITKRILPNQEYRDYFSRSGMPVTPELMALSGKSANSDNYAVINEAELKKFTHWLFYDARGVYVKFLVTHPVYTLTYPIKDAKTLLGADYFAGLPVPGYAPALPSLINELFYPIGWLWIYLWLSFLSTGLILVADLRINKRVFWFILIFFLLSIPHLYLVWHGDALDVDRHAAIANVQFHLGIGLLGLLHLDGMIAKQKRS